MYGIIFALLVLSGLGGCAKAGGDRCISGQTVGASRSCIVGRHGAVQAIWERALGSLAHVRLWCARTPDQASRAQGCCARVLAVSPNMGGIEVRGASGGREECYGDGSVAMAMD